MGFLGSAPDCRDSRTHKYPTLVTRNYIKNNKGKTISSVFHYIHSFEGQKDGLPSGMYIYLNGLDAANLSQRLAHFLDRPLFPWKKLIVGFSVAQYLFEGFLSLRQYQVLKQTRPPKVLQNEVSQEVFDKSQVRMYLIRWIHKILTRTVLWTRQSKVQPFQRSLWPNPKHRIHLL